MNMQQYLAMKHELAAVTAFVHALAAQVDRLGIEVHDLKQSLPRPVGRPRKENGEAATV